LAPKIAKRLFGDVHCRNEQWPLTQSYNSLRIQQFSRRLVMSRFPHPECGTLEDRQSSPTRVGGVLRFCPADVQIAEYEVCATAIEVIATPDANPFS
jgi:hypothetical protein